MTTEKKDSLLLYGILIGIVITLILFGGNIHGGLI